MPALRKSARERERDPRSQLHHRSSTTPYASPTTTPSEPAAEKKQRSITEWTEPQPQTLAPSFEEHGFARHGVLENMAPLGVPPKARDKLRARNLEGVAPRHSLLARGNALVGDEIASTPEVTPAPELEPDDDERHDDDETPAELPIFAEEDDDDDYEPGRMKKKPRLSKTPVRGKTPVQRTPVHARSPVKNGLSNPQSVSASPSAQPLQTPPVPDSANPTVQRLGMAVQETVSYSIKHDQRHIGAYVERMFEESKRDESLIDVMNAIIKQDANAEQWSVFRTFIKKAKKEEKTKARLLLRQERDGEQSSLQPSPRASSEVAPDDSVSAVHDLRYQLSSSHAESGLAAMNHSHTVLQSALAHDPTPNAPHPFSTAPALPAADSSAESTPRMPSKSPRKRPATNGALASGNALDINGGLSTAAPTPAGRTPDSGGSESELSDVNEEIVQKGPPEAGQANGKSATAAQAGVQKKGKNIAHARASKKGKGQAGKPPGKHGNRHQPPTAEQLAEDDRVWALRKSMGEQQPSRLFDGMRVPTSNMRFDDEILETESLTESQIAVGPPVDSNQPRRAGRMPKHGTKRLREEAPPFSSPQLESSAVTRPSTPGVGSAPKRLKLTNGQAAKTKRSPVKNRDQGPVAGVPFVGGGGSRQLGPDDHDRHSPQSESDDFCSACRGAGEFVCCETCPRVFHLICCDPPRTQVPDGAFYCYDCSAKQPRSGEAAESHISLGPLFKALERTNPRAFSLPSDVQSCFESVSARPDGAYFEENARFGLLKQNGYGYQSPDYTKVIDLDHSVILCAHCGLSSGNKRRMLRCDFCHTDWHLDCLDPPLANPPHISLDAPQRDGWMCPRHLDHDLRSGLLLQKDLDVPAHDVDMADAAPPVRITRRIRKRKNAEIVESSFSRGMQNNGLVEIINDPDDDTDGEGNYVFDADDANSKVYRISEKGIILDFCTKVRTRRIAMEREAREAREASEAAAAAAAQRKHSMNSFLIRPIEQQQAALNLVQLAQREDETKLSESKIAALVFTLTSEAPPEVVSAISNADLPPPSSAERAHLLRLQELIQRRLGA